MKILDFSTKTLITLGDLHGEFKLLLHSFNSTLELKEKNNRKQSILDLSEKVFVVCGDCGFGFNKLDYYKIVLADINEFLSKQNSILIFVRGNHDNPEYFNTDKFKLDFSNIILAPDYTVIKTNENTTLCVGGAISLDRAWRISEHQRRMRYNRENFKRIYWDNEYLQLDENIVSKLKSEDIIIDSLITHVTLLYDFFPEIKIDLEETSVWCCDDDNLINDLKQQNLALKKLYENLITNGHEIKWWCCGHYHFGFSKCIPNTTTKIIALNIFKGNIFFVYKNQEKTYNGGYSVMLSKEYNATENLSTKFTDEKFSFIEEDLASSWSIYPTFLRQTQER